MRRNRIREHLKIRWHEFLGAFFVLLLAVPAVAAEETRPNFLLVVADDLGWTDLGSFGGEIGKSGKRCPVALRIALATAASGGAIGTSPTPRTPKGCMSLGTSTMTVSIIGRSEATGMR